MHSNEMIFSVEEFLQGDVELKLIFFPFNHHAAKRQDILELEVKGLLNVTHMLPNKAKRIDFPWARRNYNNQHCFHGDYDDFFQWYKHTMYVG